MGGALSAAVASPHGNELAVFTILALASLVVLLVCRVWAIEAAPWAFAAVVLFSVLAAGDRLLRDRWLFWILALSTVLKLALAFGLFYVSYWGLPVFRSMQMGGGFWTFSPDSILYDQFGRQVIDAWRFGQEYPALILWEAVRAPSVLTGAVYYLLGATPLNMLVLNVALASSTVILAALLIRRFAARPMQIRWGTALVAFWPSLMVWCTQLLKDPVMIFLMVCALYLAVGLSTAEREVDRAEGWRWMALGLVTFPIWFLRYYIDLALVGAAFGATVASLVWQSDRLAARRPAAVCVVALLGSLVAGQAEILLYRSSSAGSTEQIARDLGRGLSSLPRVPETLGGMRRGIVAEGGAVVDPEVRIGTAGEMIRYLPRGLAVLYFAPFPWEWFDTGGSTGAFRIFATLETLVMYILFPSVIASIGAVVTRRDTRLWLMALFISLPAAAFSVAIPNLGTLFRLRLHVFIPLIILLAATGSLGAGYGWVPRVVRSATGRLSRHRGVEGTSAHRRETL